jgi:acyl-CoA synthetase (NDP forming)
LKKGNIGAIAQSGSLSMAMANSALDVGFSYIISSGNEAQLDSSDYISYMIDDEDTDVIVGFIEQFRDPEKLKKVAEKAEKNNIPIIVLKVGKSDIAREATQAHTAAIAGSDRAHDAFFRKRGIVRVDDMDQLLQTAKLFAQLKKRPPTGNNVGVLTLSGGEIGLIADVNRDKNISFPKWSETTQKILRDTLPEFITPKNPLDAWGSGNLEETYPACMDAASEDPSMDTIVVSLNAAGNLARAQVDQFKVAAKAAARAQNETDKPVVAVSNISSQLDESIKTILEEAGVPFLKGTEEAFKALENLISYGRFTRTRPESMPVREQINANRSEAEKLIENNRDGLTEYEGKKILTAYGVPTTEEFPVNSVNEALEKANRIGYPVALKALSPDIQHKTEAGALTLDIKNDDELRASYENILRNAKAYKKEAEIKGILVQEMVTEEFVEVIVGFTNDRNFGPVITFGLGGIFVELLEDVALRLPPISEETAREMVAETVGSKLLEGFRGGINADLDALIDVIIRVSLLAEDFEGKVSALDINPLLVMEEGKGVKAADALIDLSRQSTTGG